MSTTTTTDAEKNFLASNYTVFVIQINKKMLYYNMINEKDGVDYSEMKNMVKTSKDISKQCQCCNFYYFVTQNFKRSKHYCDGCFFLQSIRAKQQRTTNFSHSKNKKTVILER